MGQSLTAWTTRVRKLLGNPSTNQIEDANLEECISAAVRRFSADRPRVGHADFVGDGIAYDLEIASITSWSFGYSTVEQIEYPLGQREPLYLDSQEWILYPTTSRPTHIRLLTTVPTSGQTTRVFHTVPWPVPDATPANDLIGDIDFEPVARLAAAAGARTMTGRASSNKHPSIPAAEAMDWENEHERWRKLAEDYERDYEEHVGAEDGPPPASGWLDWDARSSFIEQGRRFLLRGRR
ncbi:MAG: hypothetical protein WD556_11375 [Actinomycetota bacterium]